MNGWWITLGYMVIGWIFFGVSFRNLYFREVHRDSYYGINWPERIILPAASIGVLWPAVFPVAFGWFLWLVLKGITLRVFVPELVHNHETWQEKSIKVWRKVFA